MRPLKLTISGFGPYRKTTVIDMESLGRGGLYLITGDTGAGKTFIFDAITYALYGDMSGSGRDSRSVRSQYSADGEKTEVELVFEYRGHRYTVKRNPEYLREKKSGEGFTKQTAGATLIKPDGSVTDGSVKVNEEIKSILGIDRGQFCSIAMIAQGEFRKVLNAGTDERQKLFRRLFNTQPYSRLSDELKELSKKNLEKYNSVMQAVNMSIAPVSCSFDDELSAALEEMKERAEKESVPADDICDLLASVTEKGGLVSASLSEAADSVDKRLNELNSILALAANHRENTGKLEEARAAVPILDEEIRKAGEALAAANGKKPDIEKLEREAALIEASIDLYDELDSVRAEKEALEESLEKKRTALSDTRDRSAKLKEEIDESETLLEELKHSGEDLLKNDSLIEKTRARTEALDSLLKAIGDVREKEKTLKDRQDELKPLLAEADRLESEQSLMLSAYMREQAGILAGSLEEGKPCPVCGAVHHPAPAEISTEAPSEKDLKEKKKEAERARKLANDKAGEAHNAKGNLDTALSSTCDAAMKEAGTADLQKAGEIAGAELIKLNQMAEELRGRRKDLKERADKAEELSKTVPQLKTSYEKMTAEAKEMEAEINAESTAAAASEARYRQIGKDLAFGSREEAESCLREKSAEAESMRAEVEKAARRSNEAVSHKHANDARISELENVVRGYEPVDEKKAEADAAAASDEKRALKQKQIQAASELKTAEAALRSVRAAAEELERIRREHEITDPLSRTANGLLQGKERITLESYVQAFYFERIIRRANKRLIMMSDGQYEFVRAGVSDDKRHLSGLDLSVLDHYSGTERPVNTLSGGESFMASLSLALGLSDEVQASAGGIRLDTMFVDEGFGSLDSETLEKAVRTLTELSEEDRLVGIISHVDSLRSRIDRQIEVTKDRDAGSMAVIKIN